MPKPSPADTATTAFTSSSPVRMNKVMRIAVALCKIGISMPEMTSWTLLIPEIKVLVLCETWKL